MIEINQAKSKEDIESKGIKEARVIGGGRITTHRSKTSSKLKHRRCPWFRCPD